MDEPEMTVVKVPTHDTGIGREAGFENDAALIAHAEAERAKMDPAAREALDEIDRRVLNALIFGT